MRYAFVLLSILICLLSVNCKKSCKGRVSTGYSYFKVIETDSSSQFFKDTVMYIAYGITRKTFQDDECPRCCPDPVCLTTNYMQAINLVDKDIDMTLNIIDRGDFDFSVKKGDTIDITPLPDICANNTWGSVKSIIYK
jgi:hypothetical protein